MHKLFIYLIINIKPTKFKKNLSSEMKRKSLLFQVVLISENVELFLNYIFEIYFIFN